MVRILKNALPTRYAAVALLALVGCGGELEGPPREAISGKVTLDGQPLKKGLITFTPSAGGSDLVVSGLVIDGEYTLPRAEGPSHGPHRVDIWSKEATGKTIPDRNDPENPMVVTREIIPPQYNVKSRLAAEVKPGDANHFEFDLTRSKVAMKSAR
ncbi:hypothetical protein EP7_004670 [Isosphaeraceae bacterium EP7]